MTRRPMTRSTDPIVIGLGATLRVRRFDKRITQEELARRTGLGKNLIGLIERAQANPNVTQLAQLASALGYADWFDLMRAARVEASKASAT